MAFRLVVPDQLAAIPLYRELMTSGTCEVIRDTPSQVGVRFSGGSEDFDAALITPIDYARHGGSYRIVPGIGVSVNGPTGSSRLRIRKDAVDITSIASDLRSTFDLAIATLLIREKYPRAGDDTSPPTVIPVQDTGSASFDACDAILDWFPYPRSRYTEDFALDVYEEWVDLTEAPLVRLIWVVREDVDSVPVFRLLADAFEKGTASLEQLSGEIAPDLSLPQTAIHEFLQRHTYGLSHDHVEAIDSLFRVAYAYGMLGDVPDVLFLDPEE